MPRGSEISAVRLLRLPESIDLQTAIPVLRRGAMPWLLDSSAEPGAPDLRLARWSFAGADPYLVLRAYGKRSELEWRRAFGRNDPAKIGSREIREGSALEILASLQPPRPQKIDAGDLSPDELPPFLAGAIGALGYELGIETEPVCLEARDDLQLPDLAILFVDRLVAIDHRSGRGFATGLGVGESTEEAEERAAEAAESLVRELSSRLAPPSPPLPHHGSVRPNSPGEKRALLATPLPDAARSDFDARGYAAAVESIRDEIAAGNVYQANLTQRVDLEPERFRGARDGELAWAIHRVLGRLSPAPFAAILELPEVAIVSSSPERYLCLDRDRGVESRPIKGTRPRGATPDEDAMLEKELAESEKDRAENLMIVDLVRNDLGRVCETGSIEVPELMSIERYATVFQMVSSVRGRLRADCGVTDLLRATFPPGSMTGAPKIAAMEIIDRLEPVRRGFYSGAVGYFDVLGGLDLSVVIRTLFVRHGRVHLHGGGAVVSDSDPLGEYDESLAKVRALLAAVAEVEAAFDDAAGDA